MSKEEQASPQAPVFSVVCVYNKPEILERDLLPSLSRQQGVEYEQVLLDTRTEKFDRASAALNEACSRARGRYLVIAHQDMEFCRPDTLACLRQECEQAFGEQGYGLLGAAGGQEGGKNYIAMGQEFTGPRVIPCMTVDECILVLPRALWQQARIADLGRTWHAYGVELSLHLSQMGYRVGIFHASVQHHWGGAEKGGQTTDLNYFCTMAKLAGRYRKTTPVIATSCGHWPTGAAYLGVLKKRLPLAIRGAVKKKFPKAWASLKKYKDRQ